MYGSIGEGGFEQNIKVINVADLVSLSFALPLFSAQCLLSEKNRGTVAFFVCIFIRTVIEYLN